MPYYQLVKDDTWNGVFDANPNILYAFDKKEFFRNLLKKTVIEFDLTCHLLKIYFDDYDDLYLKPLETFFNLNHQQLEFVLDPLDQSQVILRRKDKADLCCYPKICLSEDPTDPDVFANPYVNIHQAFFDFEFLWKAMKEILSDSGDLDYGHGNYSGDYLYFNFNQVYIS